MSSESCQVPIKQKIHEKEQPVNNLKILIKFDNDKFRSVGETSKAIQLKHT